MSKKMPKEEDLSRGRIVIGHSSIARMAGNIASGFIASATSRVTGRALVDEDLRAIARASAKLAKFIAEEVEKDQ
jgi:hypothetical protein